MSEWVDFAAVKRTVSIEAVLDYYGVLNLRRRRDQLQGRCPIHRGEREDSFRASLTKNVFQCFSCQAQGNVLDLVAAMEKCSVREAAERLQQRFGAESVRPRNVEERRTEKTQLVREKEGCNLPLRFRLTGLDHGHRYLQGRGIDRETAAAFGVGWYGGPGLMHGRIVIPIRNVAGKVVAYAGRAIDQELPKYKLPSGFRKSLELFNSDCITRGGHKRVVLVEGYFDCMRLHQAGIPAVALMGTSLSNAQERMLVERFDKIVLLLDGDTAGRTASARIAARLSGECNVQTIHLANTVQPDQLTPELLRHLVSDLSGCMYTGEGC